jgi:hypothetical protein
MLLGNLRADLCFFRLPNDHNIVSPSRSHMVDNPASFPVFRPYMVTNKTYRSVTASGSSNSVSGDVHPGPHNVSSANLTVPALGRLRSRSGNNSSTSSGLRNSSGDPTREGASVRRENIAPAYVPQWQNSHPALTALREFSSARKHNSRQDQCIAAPLAVPTGTASLNLGTTLNGSASWKNLLTVSDNQTISHEKWEALQGMTLKQVEDMRREFPILVPQAVETLLNGCEVLYTR